MIEHSLALDFSDHESLVIGILSDTHGELNSNVANFIKDCDIALHAGDIMGAHCLKALKPKLGVTISVKGNNDAASTWAEEDHPLLDSIPDQVELNLPGGTLIMEHSHRMWNSDFNKIHDSLREYYPDAQLVVYGHTHVRVIDESAKPMILNPGAAGLIRNHGGPSCVKLTANAKKWEITEHLFETD